MFALFLRLGRMDWLGRASLNTHPNISAHHVAPRSRHQVGIAARAPAGPFSLSLLRGSGTAKCGAKSTGAVRWRPWDKLFLEETVMRVPRVVAPLGETRTKLQEIRFLCSRARAPFQLA